MSKKESKKISIKPISYEYIDGRISDMPKIYREAQTYALPGAELLAVNEGKRVLELEVEESLFGRLVKSSSEKAVGGSLTKHLS